MKTNSKTIHLFICVLIFIQNIFNIIALIMFGEKINDYPRDQSKCESKLNVNFMDMTYILYFCVVIANIFCSRKKWDRGVGFELLVISISILGVWIPSIALYACVVSIIFTIVYIVFALIDIYEKNTENTENILIEHTKFENVLVSIAIVCTLFEIFWNVTACVTYKVTCGGDMKFVSGYTLRQVGFDPNVLIQLPMYVNFISVTKLILIVIRYLKK